MRHCLTDDGPQMDAERPLNDIGREQAKVMRKFLKLADVKPDVIVCSRFQRAMGTATLIARDHGEITIGKALQPDGTVDEAWQMIMSEAEDADSDNPKVLVVTHSPLIQQLLASVAFNFVDEQWEFHHGAIAYINTDDGRFRWYVDPKLAAHLVGEDPKDVETPVGESSMPADEEVFRRIIREAGVKFTEEELQAALAQHREMGTLGLEAFAWRDKFWRDVRKVSENLMADSRRSTIEPLRDQMRAAVAKRWRKQLANVRRALKTHTATDYLTASAVVATAIPFHDSGFSKAHLKVKTAAYAAGQSHASAQLGVEVEGAVQGIEARKSKYPILGTDLEDELDRTTVDRAHNALKDLANFTLPAAVAALGTLFAGFTDPGSDKLSRADTVALQTVSDGYHAGASDTAAQVSASGKTVEKAWVTEDNPCEICIANEADGYIPEDAAHDSGDFEPPQHPNCACSEVYRVAEE
jgi:phosphohistidine phosphatase SixA